MDDEEAEATLAEYEARVSNEKEVNNDETRSALEEKALYTVDRQVCFSDRICSHGKNKYGLANEKKIRA